MSKKNQWVIKHGDKWAVKGEGNSKVTKIVKTQKEAIKIGKSIAKNQKSELIIQNAEGKIRSKDSYGNDPCPPKDNEH
jgi:hypothetical protein